eukprot:COSAG06_NODE_5193_length_3646_cov_8.121229_4_plen_50_part_00
MWAPCQLTHCFVCERLDFTFQLGCAHPKSPNDVKAVPMHCDLCNLDLLE